MNFRNVLVVLLFAIAMAITGMAVDAVDYVPVSDFNDWASITDQDMGYLFNATDDHEARLSALESGNVNTGSDATEIFVENGNLVMGNQGIIPGMKIYGNGATIVINGNGSSMLNSSAPEAGAGANSMIGGPTRTAAISNTLKLQPADQTAPAEVNTTTFSSSLTYEEEVNAWIASQPAGATRLVNGEWNGHDFIVSETGSSTETLVSDGPGKYHFLGQ